jgi:biopolymer transport protein ExbD
MKSAARTSTQSDNSDVDLTPMLDVVFILLIFFVVTATFLKESSIGVNTPDGEALPDPGPGILVQVNASNEIYIDQRRVDASALRSLIAQKFAENPEQGLTVRMHEASSTEYYILVADAARQASVYNISLVPYSE